MQKNTLGIRNKKNFYQEIKGEKQTKVRNVYCKNKEGELSEGIDEKLDGWAQYFVEILNEGQDTQIDDMVEVNEQKIQVEEEKEIIPIIKSLENNKSPEEDNSVAEI